MKASVAPVERLLSIDVLRGITITFMIMVNNNGGPGSWWFMNHAEWNGMTPTDLVFPTFLFVVGMSIVFAIEARLKKGDSRGKLVRHTVERAAKLIVLGIVVNAFPLFELRHMRFYGVLGRIGLCYLVVSLFYLVDRRVWTKVAALGGILLGYWALLRLVPVPGFGVPGHDVALLDPVNNIVAWLDRVLMPGHLYEDWTTHSLRDPEGLLSTIPAVGTTLLGVLAALWLRTNRTVKQKAAGLAVAAMTSLAAGYLWSEWLPLNKKLWTSSYVLAAGGWALVVLTVAVVMVDICGWGKSEGNKWMVYPWLVFGSNAITIYMFSELVPGGLYHCLVQDGARRVDVITWFQQHFWYTVIPNPGWAAFGFALWFAAVCFVPGWVLYRKRIFIKL